jgi:hypothetical protein
MGCGQSFFYKGKKQKYSKKGYNCLADYDMPYINKSQIRDKYSNNCYTKHV